MILARLLSVTPQSDGEHFDITSQWIQDVWQTDKYAQNPAPYQRNPQLGLPNRPPYPWRPFSNSGGSIAEFRGQYGFGLKVNTANSPLTLDISGSTPVNAPPSGFAPQCPLEATVSTTGGSIPSGTYLLAIAGNVNGPVSQYFINAVIPAGTTTGSITISGVVWQAAAPAIGVYAGTCSLAIHSLASLSWAGSVNDTYGNPTTFTVTTIDPDGMGMPDPVFNSFLFQAKDIAHGGVWGASATSVGSSGGFGTATFLAATWTANQWAGYTLSSYGIGAGIGGSGPFNFKVTSNTANTLTFSTIKTPGVGVAVVMRAKSGSITASTIGDANFVNYFGPSGLTVNAEAGNLIRIIAGTGANQPLATILSNTSTVLTIAGTWAVTPDATSIFIIEAPSWKYFLPSGTITNNGAGTSPLVGSMPVPNFQYDSLLVEALTVDANGNWSVERYAPIREVWAPPMSNTAVNPGYVPLTPVAGVLSIDVSLGAAFGVTLTSSAFSVAVPTNAGVSATDGQAFDLHLFELTANYPPPTFSNATGGFVLSTTAQVGAAVSGIVNTETVIGFRRKNGIWSIKTLVGSNSIS